ncbi:transposase [Escherichia coli]|nr:transposase [Escherichia coli]
MLNASVLLPQPVNSACMNHSSTNWRSKQQNQQTSSERELEMSTEIARLKRQLAERDEELAILQKAATYFAKRLK